MNERIQIDRIGGSLLVCVTGFVLVLAVVHVKVSASSSAASESPVQSTNDAPIRRAKPVNLGLNMNLFGYAVMESGSKLQFDRSRSAEVPKQTYLRRLQGDIENPDYALLTEMSVNSRTEDQRVPINTGRGLPANISFD